jgi:hypothetical protein
MKNCFNGGRLKWKLQCWGGSLVLDGLEKRLECRRHLDREGSFLAALWCWEGDPAFGQINAVEGD